MQMFVVCSSDDKFLLVSGSYLQDDFSMGQSVVCLRSVSSLNLLRHTVGA